MSEDELRRCPFCGGHNTQIKESVYWTGTRSCILDVTVIHWCNREPGEPQSILKIMGKTRKDAISKWNTCVF